MKFRLDASGLIFLAILVFGIFLRFYNIESFGTFGHDNSRDLILTYKMYEYHEWQYRGPVFSLVWAHMSLVYYYLIFPFYYILKFHPLAPAIFSSFLNILALILMWFVAKNIFGNKAALISTSIYTVSFLVIKEGAFGLNPCFMPIFAVLFLYGLSQKLKGNWIGSLISSFSLAMLVSFHPSGFFVVPVAVIALVFFKQRFKLKEVVYSGLIFLFAAVLPYAYQQKKFNGWDIIKVREYLDTPKEKSIDFITYMTNYFKILNFNISTTLFNSSAVLFSLISFFLIIAIIYYAFKSWKKEGFIYVLAFLILVYSFVFGYVMKFDKVGLHGAWFQSVLMPWIIIFMGAALAKIKSQKSYYAILVLLLLVFAQNIYGYFNYEAQEDKFYAQKMIYQKIYEDSKGQDFDIYGEDTQPFFYMMWYYENDPVLKEKYFSWIKWAKTKDSNLVYFLDTKYEFNEDFRTLLAQQNKVSNVEKIYTFNGRNLYKIN